MKLGALGTRLFAPVNVAGQPDHVAVFVGESSAKMRIAFCIAIPLWILTIWAHQELLLGTYSTVAQHFGPDALHTARLLATVPLGIMIFVATFAVIALSRRVSVSRARAIILAAVISTLAGEGSQFFLSSGHPDHMPSFALASFIVFSAAPITARQQTFLIFTAFVLPTALLLFNGLSVFAWKMSLPFGAALVGMAVYYRVFATFKKRRLIELQLLRRTALAEQQRAEIERKKIEVERQHALAEKAHWEADRQRTRAMNLLASALTAPVAQAYERDGFVKPFTQTVVVIFCDAVQFSDSCRNLQPERVVSEMQRMWTEFDRACMDQGLRVEPLRAEGDARMAVAGLDFGQQGESIHKAAIAATLAMLRFRKVLPQPGKDDPDSEKVLWSMRIGINIGPVTAGVIDTNLYHGEMDDRGTDKQYGRLWFDVWGDTVNMAARLAQSAIPNQILVRERMLWEMGGIFDHGPVHSARAKNDVVPDLAEIVGIRSEYCDELGEPNERFWDVFNSPDYRPIRPSRQGTSPAPF